MLQSSFYTPLMLTVSQLRLNLSVAGVACRIPALHNDTYGLHNKSLCLPVHTIQHFPTSHPDPVLSIANGAAKVLLLHNNGHGFTDSRLSTRLRTTSSFNSTSRPWLESRRAE
jgi:hypothetical protein